MIRLDPFDRDEMMAAVARRLTVFREVFQIGQKELGEAVGLSQPRYSLYETGKRLLPPEIAAAICERYPVTMDWLYRGDVDTLPMNILREIQKAEAEKLP